MERFEYANPASRREAVQLLAESWGQTEVLAGGTDLISCMKDAMSAPRRVVSLKRVEDLRGIHYTAARGLRIGSMTTLREIMDNASVQRQYPALIDAADGVRSEQLRNMGTLGGDLLQRPRCWYFRLGYGLLAQHDGKSMPPEGDNRYHAIFGNAGPAYFVSPSSFAPILIALNARAELFGPRGTREIPLEKLFTIPSQAGEREHTLQSNEIVAEIMVPHPKEIRSAIYEVRQKEALDWPLSAAAVGLRMSGGTVNGARVVLGQVAPIPWRSPEAERALEGRTITEELADAAGKAAIAKATPLSMNGYKVQLTRIAIKRAILKAARGGA
ncbi:MAG: FAD binding domain-containing protein [Terriglobia bacterium]